MSDFNIEFNIYVKSFHVYNFLKIQLYSWTRYLEYIEESFLLKMSTVCKLKKKLKMFDTCNDWNKQWMLFILLN